MNRIAITDQYGTKTGRWFDSEKAECYEEETYWNGNNHISKATGSQWNHEKIYVTKSGVFIKHKWSQVQGTIDITEVISKEEAAEWFVINEYADEDIPGIFREDVSKLEIE